MSNKWEERSLVGTVLYDFAAGGEFQLSLHAGSTVEIVRESAGGWYKGSCGEQKGIFPVAYIQITHNKADNAPPSTPAPAPAPAPASNVISPPPSNAASSSSGPAAAAAQPAGFSASVSNSPFLRKAAEALGPSSSAPPPPPKKLAPPTFLNAPSSSPSHDASPAPAAADNKKLPPPPPGNTAPPHEPANSEPKKTPPPPPSTASSTPSSSSSTSSSSAPAAPSSSPSSAPAAAPEKKGPPPPPAHLLSPSHAEKKGPPPPPAGYAVTVTAASSSASSPPATPSRSAATPSTPTVGTLLNIPQANTYARMSMSDQKNLESEIESKFQDSMSVEALLLEVGHTVKEWNHELQQNLLNNNIAEYHRGMERLSALLYSRRCLQLAANEQERTHFKHEIVEMIEGSRKMQEGYMVPRNVAGQVADQSNTGVVELLNLHRVMYSNLKEESSSVWLSKLEARRTLSFKRQDQVNAAVLQSLSSGGGPSSPSGISHHASVSGPPMHLAAFNATQKKKFPSGPLQLFLNVKMCIFSVGEATDLLFSLYSNSEQRFITEDYSLSLSDQGLPINIHLLHKMRTVFVNLTAADFEKDIWLVCRIYRKGKLVFDATKAKPQSRVYKRPFGCAAFNLTESSIDSMIGKEYEPPNAAMTIYTCNSEERFSKIHEMIICKDKSLEPAPRAKGIALGLVLYRGELDAVRAADPDRMKVEDTPITQKLCFPLLLNPADTRNDLYVHLYTGSFAQDGKKAAKNVEVLIRVVDNHGETLENCISTGASDSTPVSEYHSTVIYHCNTPLYLETIRLNIPTAKMEHVHLFASFWHVSTSKKIACFSFAFLPLTVESGAVLPDAEHKMVTHKPFAKIEVGPAAAGVAAYYLGGDNAKPKLEPRKEYFIVKTQSLSTIKTQNSFIHQLFHHADFQQAKLKEILERIMQCNHGHVPEILRFIREIFNNMFEIIHSQAYQSNHNLTFQCILHILSLLSEPLINNPASSNESVLNLYIYSLFHDPNVYTILIDLCSAVLKESAQHHASAHDIKSIHHPSHNLTRLTKSIHYVLKFIIASRKLDEAGKITQQAFKQQLSALLKSINQLVAMKEENADPSSYLLTSQSYLVKSFPDSIPDLQSVFDAAELANIAKELILAIPNVSSQHLNKLQLIRNLMSSDIGEQSVSRDILFPVVIRALEYHFMQIDETGLSEIILAIDIISNMLNIIQKSNNSSDALIPQFLTLLQPIVHVVLRIQLMQKGEISLKPATEAVLKTCKVDLMVDSHTVLWTLLQIWNEQQLQTFLQQLSRPNLLSFLSSFLQVCDNSIHSHLYPDLWIVMHMVECVVITKMLQQFTQHLQTIASSAATAIVDESTIESKVFLNYFTLIMGMLISDTLRLEEFPPRKQAFVSTRYGDIRGELMDQFRHVWTSLGSGKSPYVSSLVSRLFELADKSKPNTASSVFSFDIYFDIIQHEYQAAVQQGATEYFTQVERHTIDSLYNMANVSIELSNEFMKSFYSELQARSKDKGAFTTACMEYLSHISRMYELMSSLLQFPHTDLYEDERTHVSLRLISYLESSGHGHVRKDMYLKYVQYLVDLHQSLNNYTEAGCALKQAIQILDWKKENVLAAFKSTLLSYPAQIERERKEKLYLAAIKFFEQGEEWERAIEYCEELRMYYQFEIFDYLKLSNIMKQQADYFRNIVSVERFYANYFRVCYYGSGFDTVDSDNSITEKEYVYRGVKLEPVMDFTNRLKKKYPNAKIFMSSDKPTDEMLKQHTQIISITTLTRASEKESVEILEACNISCVDNSTPNSLFRPPTIAPSSHPLPNSVQKYRDNNQLRVFVFSKGVQKSPDKKPANEFKHLWVSKTFVVVSEAFPTNRRRLEIISKREIMVSPIQNAISSMLNKTSELLEKMEQVSSAPGAVDVGPLSMNLNGMIDAAVNGGTQKYIEAFLGDEYLSENHHSDESKKQQQELKQSLKEQISALKIGLDVFGKRCDDKLKGLYNHLTGFYDQMVAKTQSVLA